MPASSETTHLSFALDDYEQSIAAAIEKCISLFPDHLAIRSEESAITYQELNSTANRISNQILASHPGTNQPIGICIADKPRFLCTLLGVLKTGNFAIPIDPDFPIPHNRFIIQDAQIDLLLTDDEWMDRATQLLPTKTTLNIEDMPASSSTVFTTGLIPPDAKALLLYTSGSTGQPKGVIHNQRGLLHNAIRQSEKLEITADDHISMLYSNSVMGSTRDYLNALTSGACLYPFEVRKLGIAPLPDWIARQEITILHTISSLFRQFEGISHRKEDLETLRVIILGGEAVLKSDFEIFKRHFPDRCRLFAGLGSTETGTIRTILVDKTAQIHESIFPVGYPVRDVEILLQDEIGNPVPTGGIGEIVVRSPFIAQGYWNRPDLNQETFLPDPEGGEERLFRTGDLGRFLPDGCLVHCGRKDYQVKIRGFRIELQEIESALLASGLLKDAVVISHSSKEGENRLVAYVVPQTNTINLEEDLRKSILPLMPDHMIPCIFITMKTLPRTPNGKVDRKALPAPIQSPALTAPPPDEVSLETEMAYLWGAILSIGLPGLDDDFFALGGDSLRAAALFVEIEKRYGTRFPLAALIENNTVRKLAARIEHDTIARKTSLVTIRSQGSQKPLFILPGGSGDTLYLRNLLKHIDPDRPLYGLQAASTGFDPTRPVRLEETASAYLREILPIQPEGPYYLAGHSYGGYIAMEMARQLLERGQVVAFLGLWDTYPPGPRRKASLPNRFKIHLQNLRGRDLHHRLEYFQTLGNNLLLRAARFAPIRAFLRWSNFTPPNAMFSARIARAAYHPDPYPGNLYLFRANQRQWYVQWDPMEKWQKYVAGKLEIRDVPGEHGNLLFEPHVQGLVQQLNACLREVTKSEAPPK